MSESERAAFTAYKDIDTVLDHLAGAITGMKKITETMQNTRTPAGLTFIGSPSENAAEVMDELAAIPEKLEELFILLFRVTRAAQHTGKNGTASPVE